MEKSSKRGKIPQSDWPLIMARYEAGETLASIARTYDCSPPAISYVVSRSRVRLPGAAIATKPVGGPEPQLIKSVVTEGAPAPLARPPAAPAGAVAPNSGREIGGPEAERAAMPERLQPATPGHNGHQHGGAREANGFVPNGAAEHGPGSFPGELRPPMTPVQRQLAPNGGVPHANADHRRTLHLSLGNPGHGNGASHHPAEVHQPAPAPSADRGHAAHPGPAAPAEGGANVSIGGFTEIRPAAYDPIRRTESDAAPRREGGVFIDRELRARVDSDIAVFLAAFDAALLADTQESRSALREATDRLLRAGARTRIELERLEARLPLPARDAHPDRGRDEPGWRYR